MESAPTWAEVLLSWRGSPLVEVPAWLAAAGYVLLVRRLRRRGSGRWPRGRLAAWGVAVAVLVIALDGPVAVFAEVLFWVHMIQHLLLIMVVPVLLVWAQPLRLLRSAGGGWLRVGLDRIVGSRPLRWATSPLPGLAIYAPVVVLTHLTGFQQVSLTNPWVRFAELALYLVSGYLFFLPLTGAELGPPPVPALVRLAVLALGMGADTLTGVVLMLVSRPLAPAYEAAHPGWGPGAMADQEAAGAVMWFGGDALMAALMIIVAIQWVREEREGEWLEGIRRRTLFGDRPQAPVSHDAASQEPALDDDEQALAAYNAMLARLHGRDEGARDERRRADGSDAGRSSDC